jgi:HEAT repeat protein
MNGAVEGMLAVLEDPRAENADSALAGLLARYQAGGPAVLRPYKDRFRTMLTDRDPGLRQVSAWALARTGDLDVAPDLISVLVDGDPGVVDAARQGLQLLSRKLTGLGPPPGSTPEQRAEAARRWREWYNRTRPLDLDGQDDDPTGASVPGVSDRRPR